MFSHIASDQTLKQNRVPNVIWKCVEMVVCNIATINSLILCAVAFLRLVNMADVALILCKELSLLH